MELRRILAAIGAFIILAFSAGTAHAQSGLYFYCYAPDPDSGTVYMSQPQPAGPVAERAGYGAAYVAYLRSTKRVKGEAQAYCTMRGSEADLTRAQQQLPRESCPECVGIQRFAQVAWPRNGAAQNTKELVTVSRAPPAVAPVKGAAATEVVQFNISGVAVLGHAATGRIVRVVDGPDRLARAKAQALAIEPSGWMPLLASDKPGFGVVICVMQGRTTHFFPVHGLPSQRAAVDAAKAGVAAFVGEHRGLEKACSAPWQAGAGNLQAIEPVMLDSVKSLIEKEVACEPSLPRQPPGRETAKGAAREESSRREPCTLRSDGAPGVRG